MSNEEVKNLKEALHLSPDNVPLRLHLAATLFRWGELAEAVLEFQKVLEKDDQNRKARFGLSEIYLKRKEYSLAIIILEELLIGHPDDTNCLLLYSRALLNEGSNSEALEAYQKAIALNPNLKDEELDAVFRRASPGSMKDSEQDEDDYFEDDTSQIMEKPNIGFEQVGGMERVKEEIRLKIIHPLQHPELYAAYGKKIGGGILLYGPPGCGKTHLARATAGQIQAHFISVGISDILDMWIGNSERNLKEIFELARRNAPCVLFFDEIDALGANRSDMRQSGGRRLINQFLAELDGVDTNNEGVLVLGATNAPWHLDPAFRRPGRFDRIVFVEPPNSAARASILDILLKGKPIESIDSLLIAKKTEGFSGADLQAVVDIAIESKLTSSFATGIPQPIRTKDLLQAVKAHNASTREWFNTAKNYAIYSNESGHYDDILTYLKIKK